MKIGILDEKLGVMVIDSLEDLGHIQTMKIKNQMPECANLNDLAFFYMSDRDWIVINQGHEWYWYYSQIIPIYLTLSEDSRRKCRIDVPTDETRRAFDILDDVISRRQLISGIFERKAV